MVPEYRLVSYERRTSVPPRLRGKIAFLGQPVEQPHYSAAAQVVGWTYHFSNGITFGVMYLALLGDAARRHWLWGALLAAGIELAMLLTPYSSFAIRLTAAFVAVTLIAHLVFGSLMGLLARAMAQGNSMTRQQRAGF